MVTCCVGDGNNQRFIRDGPFIRAVYTGKVLDVSREDGSIVQWEAHGLKKQRWEFHSGGTISWSYVTDCLNIEVRSISNTV
jgi:hypothetical protein